MACSLPSKGRTVTLPPRTAYSERNDVPHCKLPTTLQTFSGMVINDGSPAYRLSPSLDVTSKFLRNVSLDPEQIVAIKSPGYGFNRVLTTCVLARQVPDAPLENVTTDSALRSSILRLRSNTYACCNQAVTVNMLKYYIRFKKRLDHEQAAALVIAAIGNDDTISSHLRTGIIKALLDGLDDDLLSHGNMWLDEVDVVNGVPPNSVDAKFNNLATWVAEKILVRYDADEPDVWDWGSMVSLLLRMRRCTPGDRCLWIPDWMFEKADLPVPPNYPRWQEDGRTGQGIFPTCHRVGDGLVLSRKLFRALQRRVVNYYRFWDPTNKLHSAITDLQDNILYCSDIINSIVSKSSDTLLVAHYFFAFQRRLQRRVVSDAGWTRFLAKGEGRTILQNDPNIKTLFEEDLSNFAGQSGVPIPHDIHRSIDHCCLLMEGYVRIFGDGDRGRLVFRKGEHGGSGRGPVDYYNLLCDILRPLRDAAAKNGLEAPGTVRKFLAKDIMAWNDAWQDDAFAGGMVPGWEPWLRNRRRDGTLTK